MGCGILELLFPINYPQRYIEREVNNTELVGTWKITPDSETRMIDYFQQKDSKLYLEAPWKSISLNKDGSCKVDLEVSWSLNNEVLEEADALSTCTWKTDKILGYKEHGSFNHVSGLTVSFEHFNKQENNYHIYYSEFYIVEENKKLVLWNFIGDPAHLSYQDFMRVNQ
jgi:hypothetical protein